MGPAAPGSFSSRRDWQWIGYNHCMCEDRALEDLNAVKYLYLRQLSEPSDNALQIVVQEAVENRSAGARPTSLELPELAEILKDSWPIETTEGCKTFELYWKSYAAYLVCEEMFGSVATGRREDEVFTGRMLRVYSKSHFLDYFGAWPLEPIQHYRLLCLNHLIDVAAYAPPEIRVIAAPTQRT
jgi:hypothetical protein